MTREEAFKEINETQDYYINELITMINDTNHAQFKSISFTSATGTGKTMMMAKLINSLSNYYFIVTTLSKGQLNRQISDNLAKYCASDRFTVYGTCDYKINSKLQAEDILNSIPANTECIWLRDEGHIKTNKFDEILMNRCYKVINFSATNMHSDIKCNFTNTMMLRTVHQNNGTPEEAIKKLLEIKRIHKSVNNYNPCAIFRCIDSTTFLSEVAALCAKYKLKYINITDETFDMAELCKDDNEYDVIINKFKIVEGIDLRRAHVVYMDNKPSNNATTIQVIGRCRRNALLYRDDIDIFSNKQLLAATNNCYVYYNVEKMKIDTDENGELEYAFCNTISVEQLKPNSFISVENGQMANGLDIIELVGETGTFEVLTDAITGFNIIKPAGNFYKTKTGIIDNSQVNIYYEGGRYCTTTSVAELAKFTPCKIKASTFNYMTGQQEINEIDVIDFDEEIKKDFKFSSSQVNHIIKRCNKILSNIVEPKYNAKAKTKPWRTSIPFLRDIESYLEATDETDTEKLTAELTLTDDLIYFYTKSFKDFKEALRATNTAKSKIKTELQELGFHYNHEAVITVSRRILSRSFEPKPSKVCKSIYMIADNSTTMNTAGAQNHWHTRWLHSHYIKLSDLFVGYSPYTKVINDRLSAIVGVDTMKQIETDDGNGWIEDKAVTGKVSRYCKLNTFIQNTYCSQLNYGKEHLFSGKNNFNFDAACNKCLGYCVEYYSKYLVYGDSYLKDQIAEVRREAKLTKDQSLNTNLIIRACMLKYKDMMRRSFGLGVDKIISTIGVQKLIQQSYCEFVNTVCELGNKAAIFVKNTLYKDYSPVNCIDPNLSIEHISGLADYITEDTILDIKTTNHIDITMLKQVLAYHYLSTKRSDLHIKRVIVFDAVSGRHVELDVSNITFEAN